jgi:hypothetical protein
VKQKCLFTSELCLYIRLEIDMPLLHEWHECFTREPHAPVHVRVCRVYRFLLDLLAETECVFYPQKYCISVKSVTALNVSKKYFHGRLIVQNSIVHNDVQSLLRSIILYILA